MANQTRRDADSNHFTPAFQSENTVSIQDLAKAILIGVLAGGAATGFHFLADRFGEILFRWAEGLDALRIPLIILIPTLGMLLVGLALQVFPSGRHGGVREVVESLDEQEGKIPWSRAVNVVLGGLVLAFGGSVGPEGPMVQMGALLGSKVGQRRGADVEALKRLVRAGAAAGVAAGFRSPAGGVLLAVEVLGAHVGRDVPVVGIAAAFGYLTRTALLGSEYPFALSNVPSALRLEVLLIVMPLMGALAAPVGHLFIRMMTYGKRCFPETWPLWLRVMLGGFMIGCIGIFYPEVRSVGYSVIVRGLHDGMSFRLFTVLMLLKMLATSITFSSGAVGGLFAPTLFIGAMFGGAFGYALRAIDPALAPEPALFILLGMVVLFGSIVKGYWSGLLLVADISGTYHLLLLPGIIAGGVSYLLSWKLHNRSVFDLRQV